MSVNSLPAAVKEAEVRESERANPFGKGFQREGHFPGPRLSVPPPWGVDGVFHSRKPQEAPRVSMLVCSPHGLRTDVPLMGLEAGGRGQVPWQVDRRPVFYMFPDGRGLGLSSHRCLLRALPEGSRVPRERRSAEAQAQQESEGVGPPWGEKKVTWDLLPERGDLRHNTDAPREAVRHTDTERQRDAQTQRGGETREIPTN